MYLSHASTAAGTTAGRSTGTTAGTCTTAGGIQGNVVYFCLISSV